jgi:hypothetical protein
MKGRQKNEHSEKRDERAIFENRGCKQGYWPVAVFFAARLSRW